MRRGFHVLRAVSTALPVALALLFGGSCTPKKNTELMIAIQTDLATPKDLDAVRIQVSSNGVVQFREDYINVGGEGVHLPASIGITPSDRDSRSVDIEIYGVQGKEIRILRRARTTFAKDRVALLRLPLRFSCYNKLDCKGEQSCVAGECKDPTVAVEALPDYQSQEQISGKPTTGTSTEPDGCWDPLACLSPSTRVTASPEDRCVFPIPSESTQSGLTVILASASGNLGFCDERGCKIPLDQDSDEGWDFTDSAHTKIRIAKGICAKIDDTTTVSISTLCGTKTIVRPFCDVPKPQTDSGPPPVDTSMPPETGVMDAMPDTSMPVDTAPVDTGPVITAHDPGPPMATPRARFATVVLSDGRVAVIGGYEAKTGVATKTCEVFDPTTNAWLAGGCHDMTTARYGAAAAPFMKGLVIVGGRNESGSLSTSEHWLGPGGDWALAPSIPDGARPGGHTLTPLPSGQMLLTGGQGLSYIATAYLLDATATTWSPAKPMSIGRAFHTATVLASGKVLVVGGESDTGFVSSAELYDPKSDTWTPAKGLSAARSRHQATLLKDGRVLVTGGGLKTAEIYDPTTDNWSLAGSESDGRGNHVAILLPDGKVFVAGGEPGGISTTELWSPETTVWTPGTPLNVGRTEFSAVLLERKIGSFSRSILVIGGKSSGASNNTTELFNF